MMNLINQAQQMVERYIKENRPEPAIHKENVAHPPPTNSAEIIGGIQQSAMEKAVNAIFTYYQYGLENIHQRSHGIGRIHYRTTLRKITAAVVSLEKSANSNPNDKIVHLLQFVRSFSDAIHLSQVFDPNSSHMNTIAYRHYYNGSRLLDLSIKNGLFTEFSTKNRRTLNTTQLIAAQEEMKIVLMRYPQSKWVAEAAIKMQLLLCFKEAYDLF